MSTIEGDHRFTLWIEHLPNGDIKQSSLEIRELATHQPTSAEWLDRKIVDIAKMRLCEMYDEYRNKLLSTSTRRRECLIY